MVENKDYVYVPKMFVNEGIKSMTATKASVFFTPRFIFVIPQSTINLSGETIDYPEAKEIIKSIESGLHDMTIQDLEQKLTKILPPERVFIIQSLELLKIWIGFWSFGNVIVKRRGESRKSFAVQPKLKRQAVYYLYNS